MVEGTLEIRGDSVFVRKCCGSEVPLNRYLGPLDGTAVRLEQRCSGEFALVPVNREDVQVNSSLLRVQHGERVTERGRGEVVEVCRICGHPVGGM